MNEAMNKSNKQQFTRSNPFVKKLTINIVREGNFYIYIFQYLRATIKIIRKNDGKITRNPE